MHSLWFKQRFVDDILSGRKSSTYRIKRPRFAVGDTLAASVGPRLPFAHLRIDRIDEVTFDSLDDATRHAISDLYNVDAIDVVFHIHFTPVNSK